MDLLLSGLQCAPLFVLHLIATPDCSVNRCTKTPMVFFLLNYTPLVISCICCMPLYLFSST